MRDTLVIGYGNDLRGDDGAGVRAAQLIAERNPAVDCLQLHQLTPELTSTISGYKTIIFIDASLLVARPSMVMLYPESGGTIPPSHNSSPQGLLNLCQHLYSQSPLRAILIQIPAHDLNFGKGHSLETERNIEQCVELVGKLLSPIAKKSPMLKSRA